MLRNSNYNELTQLPQLTNEQNFKYDALYMYNNFSNRNRFYIIFKSAQIAQRRSNIALKYKLRYVTRRF